MAIAGESWPAEDSPANGSWNYRLSADGRELFRARFDSADANWVGG
jgi:hypothetical protein